MNLVGEGGKERRTVDPLALFTAEREDGLSDICGCADALQGAHLGEAGIDDLHGHSLIAAGHVVPAVLVVHVRLDATRSDSVDGDALLATIDGESASETLNGSLGASIQSMVGNTADGRGDGRGKDDPTASAAVLQALLCDEELAPAVEVEDLVEQLRSNLDFWAPYLHAAVGDDNVKVAEVLDSLLEELRDGGRVADVRLQGDALRAELGQLGNDLFGGLAAATVVDYDVGASPSQLNSNAPADATARSGDECDLAG